MGLGRSGIETRYILSETAECGSVVLKGKTVGRIYVFTVNAYTLLIGFAGTKILENLEYGWQLWGQ